MATNDARQTDKAAADKAAADKAAADKAAADYAAKFAAKQKAKPASGPARAVSGSARNILAILRKAGQSAEGLTTEQVRRKAAFAGSATQLRRRIREAQTAAAHGGDLVFTDLAVSVEDLETGEEKLLPRATKRYYVVEKRLADTLPQEMVAWIKTDASDFRFGNDVKSTSRASLTAEYK
jgi:alkanesulfonate monooxygenase SsuD/methylene tetrahydromethanopterin reductase-like flavin-dependent oxidoreductase (luciferase family)